MDRLQPKPLMAASMFATGVPATGHLSIEHNPIPQSILIMDHS